MSVSLQKRSRIVASALLLSSGLVGCSTLSSQNNTSFTESGNDLQRHVYVGTGLGLSRLEPDTSEVSNDVNDRVEPTGQITLGMDITKHLAVEVHSADLGSAGISPAGRINYHQHGISGLLYAGKNRDNFKRRGLSGYGRFGLGFLENSTVGPLNLEQENKTHLIVGGGMEYVLGMGLGVRAEGVLIDQDVRFGQLALVYRMGKQPESAPIEIVKVPEPVVVAPVAAVAVVEPVITEEVSACNAMEGALDGVNFKSSSADLSDKAINVLNGVASILRDCPTIPVRVDAHTDSRGAEEFNFVLSKQRAESVVRYLKSQGIDPDRLSSMPFGESKPIDTNETALGRLRNRRVELLTQ